jgi:hypothetical protein
MVLERNPDDIVWRASNAMPHLSVSAIGRRTMGQSSDDSMTDPQELKPVDYFPT